MLTATLKTPLRSFLCLLAVSVNSLAQETGCELAPVPYTANYSVTRSDKEAGSMTVVLERVSADTFTYRLETRVKRGMVKANIEQSSSFTLRNGQIMPDSFQSVQRVLFYKKQESVDFDWASLTASGKKKLRDFKLEITPGVQDKLTYNLALATALCHGETSFETMVASGPVLNNYAHAIEAEEVLDTNLGRLQTVHVRRGTPDSQKQTDSWHAKETRFLPVKIVYRNRNDINIMQLDDIAFEDPESVK